MLHASIRFLAFLGLTAAAHTALADGLVLRDDFSNRASGWPHRAATSSKDLGFSVYTDSGAYQITPVSDTTVGFIGAPRQARSGDVRIESDVFLYAGIGSGAAGVACRYKDHANYYGFIAAGNHTYMIMKIENGKATRLAQGSYKGVMAGAVDTRLRAECRGTTLRLSAKDGGSIEAHDTAFSAGASGLLVMAEKMAGTSGTFDNFVLSDLAN